ncbi:DNA polymerase/3'-5' exonuclease PolX [Cytophagales bacterium LB-30]|uniref:DNA polymerase/3'-5' exonuclease PolX n=1 Tax=Shiella aurantiaca TaxID=3058365 RepID=A0ABT8F951_9BACT|nr:DNA polymerase/3'-5' exonuclease PolX [Shiella aurantiaca]MDN4166894.1 DNA polymerase/3'-5' exonuclease PolX [Shiella aurantiaca]
MNNEQILDTLQQLASLMELHGENDFKVRGYQSAIFNLEKSTAELSSLSAAELEKLPGVGKSIAAAIYELAQSGELASLQKLREATPAGVIDMLNIKGIGPKKIRLIWKELEIETLDDLRTACEQHQIAKLKGFGEKTEENILKALIFTSAQKGKLRYADAEKLWQPLVQALQQQFPEAKISESGLIRRRWEVIDSILLVVGSSQSSSVRAFLNTQPNLSHHAAKSSPYYWRGEEKSRQIPLEVRFCSHEEFASVVMKTTGNGLHLHQIKNETESLFQYLQHTHISNEAAAYAHFGLPFIAPELREGMGETQANEATPALVELADLKGILHNHSTYSDGKHSLEEMASYCKALGYEYLGISDHSKSAFYANGLKEDRIVQQHQEIDALNAKLAPFKILKGIESDILNDGALDYDDKVLASFDFIVASIHSNLKMTEQKATERLLKAIANPYTTMLGHPTGRLLLQREGYPIDHKAVIDACAQHQVVIEINAHPWRLDLDWRWVRYALQQGVMLSINPDAHEKDGYKDMYYGLLAGRKGGLHKAMTFNALSLTEVEAYLKKKKEGKLIAAQ